MIYSNLAAITKLIARKGERNYNLKFCWINLTLLLYKDKVVGRNCKVPKGQEKGRMR